MNKIVSSIGLLLLLGVGFLYTGCKTKPNAIEATKEILKPELPNAEVLSQKNQLIEKATDNIHRPGHHRHHKRWGHRRCKTNNDCTMIPRGKSCWGCMKGHGHRAVNTDYAQKMANKMRKTCMAKMKQSGMHRGEGMQQQGGHRMHMGRDQMDMGGMAGQMMMMPQEGQQSQMGGMQGQGMHHQRRHHQWKGKKHHSCKFNHAVCNQRGFCVLAKRKHKKAMHQQHGSGRMHHQQGGRQHHQQDMMPQHHQQ